MLSFQNKTEFKVNYLIMAHYLIMCTVNIREQYPINPLRAHKPPYLYNSLGPQSHTSPFAYRHTRYGIKQESLHILFVHCFNSKPFPQIHFLPLTPHYFPSSIRLVAIFILTLPVEFVTYCHFPKFNLGFSQQHCSFYNTISSGTLNQHP